ncbi:MAG TPA: DUF4192 family protein [Microbacteriaceae bacterium]|nr:DUF4192 family protein [Microbacteriaceae bacterium]HPZ33845.1 DUF4192 family protein [Microbacteriaceae bacterium]HQC93769.1 DUF4192 family protein [Microbacteriaceae bacterium]
MHTVITAKSAADFLALVPALTGYTPTRSIALVAFRGSRTLGVLRVDLPPADADAQSLASAAATFVGMICRLPDADGLAPVVYTEGPLRAGTPPRQSRRGAASPDGAVRRDRAPDSPHARIAHSELIDAVRRCADACGLAVRDALCVAADGWASYLEPHLAHPLSALDAAAARADLPAHTAPTRGDQHSGAELPDVDPCERVRVAMALADLQELLEALDAGAGTPRGDDPEDDDDVAVAAAAELDDLCDVRPARAGEPGRFRAFARAATTSALAPEPPGSRAAATALGALCDIPGLFERALDAAPDQLDTGTTAALLLCLSRPPLRDVALSQWSFSIAVGAEVLEAQVLWHDGEAFPARLATHMVGEGPSPDLARVRAALALVRHLSAVAPAQWRCAPLTVAAWLSWALGRSTHASDFLALALEIDPGYGLAEIVSTMVRSGHLPEWAFGRSDTLRAPGLDRETGGSRGAT